jgi:hypothetical protein
MINLNVMAARIALCCVFPCVLAAQDRADASEMQSERGKGKFADALKQIVRASRCEFRTVEGARIDFHPGRRSWFEAKVYLPSASYCRILDDPKLEYNCEWAPTPNRTDLSRFYETLVAGVEAALGSDWKRRSEGPGKAVIFEGQGTSNGVSIKVLPPGRGPEPLVHVFVTPARGR